MYFTLRATSLSHGKGAAIGTLALMLLAAGIQPARAIEDTDTPGAGRWEINFGRGALRSAAGWEVALPDTDFNYGWGEHAQLTLALARLTLRADGQEAVSGLGAATVGLKWRILNQDDSAFALAAFPKYSRSVSSGSLGRRLSPAGSSLLLPLIAGLKSGDAGYFAELGRNIVQEEPDEWVAGLKVLHQCLPSVECRVELQHSLVARAGGETLAGVGAKWRLSESLVLQGSVGREMATRGAEARRRVVYLGVQILR